MRILPLLVMLAIATTASAATTWQLDIDGTLMPSFGPGGPVAVDLTMHADFPDPPDGAAGGPAQGTFSGLAFPNCIDCRDVVSFASEEGRFTVTGGGGPSPGDFMLSVNWPAADGLQAGWVNIDTDQGLINWGHGERFNMEQGWLETEGWLDGTRELSVVPEPSAVMLLLIGVAILRIGR